MEGKVNAVEDKVDAMADKLSNIEALKFRGVDKSTTNVGLT